MRQKKFVTLYAIADIITYIAIRGNSLAKREKN